MKKALLTLLIIGQGVVFAQETTSDKLQKLSAPSSPASAVIGIQPSAVLAPKSYNALETALFNDFTDDGNFVIPKDLGLEFSPYWTKSHQLSISDYLYPSFGQSLAMNTSFSLASSQNFKLGDSSNCNILGLGIRTSIFIPFNDDRSRVDRYRDSLSTIMKIESSFSAKLKQLLDDASVNSTDDLMQKLGPYIVKKLVELKYVSSADDAQKLATEICKDTTSLPPFVKGTDNQTNAYRSAMISLIRKHTASTQTYEAFQQYLRYRNGLYLDIAYGSSIGFPTNDFEFSYVPKNSIWLTPSYHFFNNEKHGLKLMFVYRYEFHNLDFYRAYFPNSTVYKNNNDYGFAFAADFPKWTLQAELVGRSSNTEIPVGTDANNNVLYIKQQSNDLQYLGTFNYRLTDQMVLTYSLGNRFNPITNPNSTLVSTLSINLGFGTPDQKVLDLTRPRKKPVI